MEHTFFIDNYILVLEGKKIKLKKKRKKFLTNPIFDIKTDFIKSKIKQFIHYTIRKIPELDILSSQ